RRRKKTGTIYFREALNPTLPFSLSPGSRFYLRLDVIAPKTLTQNISSTCPGMFHGGQARVSDLRSSFVRSFLDLFSQRTLDKRLPNPSKNRSRGYHSQAPGPSI